MVRAIDLLKQERHEDLWDLCCGYTSLDIEQFMAIQERLLLEQIQLMSRCKLGQKLMAGYTPTTMEEFRQRVPLTAYQDYCPSLAEKKDADLPSPPMAWARTSGKTGEGAGCKWIPLAKNYSEELSAIMYGLGVLAGCKERGDTSPLPPDPKLVYSVAPRPYFTGYMATMLEQQSPMHYLPPVELAEKLAFDERVKLSFEHALSEGIDYFFGLSMVLAIVGEKFVNSSGKTNILPLLSKPKSLLRLGKGLLKSKLARRPLMPKDLWNIKGIICGGLDSTVYREKIKELWGRYPLDVYASTEGGIIATQTWNYKDMTFIPNLNFLEFIPEREQLRYRMDPDYKPQTVLLSEVNPGESYEMVISNFHGGALMRYRTGDMIKITSLHNAETEINLPQMLFERRIDDLLDFFVIRLTEKTIWQAIEESGISYKDWVAYKEEGAPVLKLFIETKDGCEATESEMSANVYHHLMNPSDEERAATICADFVGEINFQVDIKLLPKGTFANYTAYRQAEGAELAHLKPSHINPTSRAMGILQNMPAIPVSSGSNTRSERAGVA